MIEPKNKPEEGLTSCLSETGIEPDKYQISDEDPDEDCINCMLDRILRIDDPDARSFWIYLHRTGQLSLQCGKTGKTYRITPEFFERHFNHL